MRVTCKHCGGPHPAFECRKKKSTGQLDKSGKSGEGYHVLPVVRRPVDANQPVTATKSTVLDAKQRTVGINVTGSQQDVLTSAPVDTNAGGRPQVVRGGPSEKEVKLRVQVPPTGAKFDKKAWQREYMREYMRKRRASLK